MDVCRGLLRRHFDIPPIANVDLELIGMDHFPLYARFGIERDPRLPACPLGESPDLRGQQVEGL